MKVYHKPEVEFNKERLELDIRNGAVFIYPTDTIYGIGCNAMDDNAIKKIREVKKRHDMPFSVIAPSKEWIYENCEVGEEAKRWIEEKLPGSYTFIFKLKNPDAISKHVNNGLETLGVRIPAHWCSEVVSSLKIPLITTSANLSGYTFMTSLEDLHSDVKMNMDFALYDGELKGKPSKIIDFSQEDVKIKER